MPHPSHPAHVAGAVALVARSKRRGGVLNVCSSSLQKIGIDPSTGVHKTGYGGWVCMLADGVAYLGGRGGGAQGGTGGVLRWTNPTDAFLSATEIVSGTEGIETGFIRSDRQTGTKWACCLPHSTDVLVQSGGVVQTVTGPGRRCIWHVG